MARPLRIEYPDAIYHITARGNEKKVIFRDDEDYVTCLRYLNRIVKTFQLNIFAYALMPNHYHLVLQTLDANLSRAMHQLNTSYTVYFNRKYGRVGHLFQGRYHAILVQKNPYLLEVSRYVHLNAFRAHLVDDPFRYRWSSYHYYVGKRPAPDWLNTDFVLEMIAKGSEEQKYGYKKFIGDGMVDSINPFDKIYAQTILGDDNFVDVVSGRMALKEDQEIPATKRFGDKISFEEIIGAVSKILKKDVDEIIKGGRFSLGRKIAIYFLRNRTDISLKEIGRHFDISYTAVTHVKKAFEKKLHTDTHLKKLINQISAELSSEPISNFKT